MKFGHGLDYWEAFCCDIYTRDKGVRDYTVVLIVCLLESFGENVETKVRVRCGFSEKVEIQICKTISNDHTFERELRSNVCFLVVYM